MLEVCDTISMLGTRDRSVGNHQGPRSSFRAWGLWVEVWGVPAPFQLPLKTPSNKEHEALNRDTFGDLVGLLGFLMLPVSLSKGA